MVKHNKKYKRLLTFLVLFLMLISTSVSTVYAYVQTGGQAGQSIPGGHGHTSAFDGTLMVHPVWVPAVGSETSAFSYVLDRQGGNYDADNINTAHGGHFMSVAKDNQVETAYKYFSNSLFFTHPDRITLSPIYYAAGKNMNPVSFEKTRDPNYKYHNLYWNMEWSWFETGSGGTRGAREAFWGGYDETANLGDIMDEAHPNAVTFDRFTEELSASEVYAFFQQRIENGAKGEGNDDYLGGNDLGIRRLASTYLLEAIAPNTDPGVQSIMTNEAHYKFGLAAVFAACDASGIPFPNKPAHYGEYDGWLRAYCDNNLNANGSPYYVVLEVTMLVSSSPYGFVGDHALLMAWLSANTGNPQDVVANAQAINVMSGNIHGVRTNFTGKIDDWQRAQINGMLAQSGTSFYRQFQDSMDIYHNDTSMTAIPIGYSGSNIRGQLGNHLRGYHLPNSGEYQVPGYWGLDEICSTAGCGHYGEKIPQCYQTPMDMLSGYFQGNYSFSAVYARPGVDSYAALSGSSTRGNTTDTYSCAKTDNWANVGNRTVGYNPTMKGTPGANARGVATAGLSSHPVEYIEAAPISPTVFYAGRGLAKEGPFESQMKITWDKTDQLVLQAGESTQKNALKGKIEFNVHAEDDCNIGHPSYKLTFHIGSGPGHMQKVVNLSGENMSTNVQLSVETVATLLQQEAVVDIEMTPRTPTASQPDPTMTMSKISIDAVVTIDTGQDKMCTPGASTAVLHNGLTVNSMCGLEPGVWLGGEKTVAHNTTGWINADFWCYHTSLEPRFYAEIRANEMARRNSGYDSSDWDVLAGIPSTENLHVVMGGDLFQINVCGNFVKQEVTRKITIRSSVTNTWGGNYACTLSCPLHTLCSGGGTTSTSATGQGSTSTSSPCPACNATVTAVGYNSCPGCGTDAEGNPTFCGGCVPETDVQSHDCTYTLYWSCSANDFVTSTRPDVQWSYSKTSSDLNTYNQGYELHGYTVSGASTSNNSTSLSEVSLTTLLDKGYTVKGSYGCVCSSTNNAFHQSGHTQYYTIEYKILGAGYLNIVDYQVYGLSYANLTNFNSSVLLEEATYDSTKDYSASNSLIVDLWDIYDEVTQDMVASYKPGNGRIMFQPFRTSTANGAIYCKPETSYRKDANGNGVDYTYYLGDAHIELSWVMDYDYLESRFDEAIGSSGINEIYDFPTSLTNTSNRGSANTNRWDDPTNLAYPSGGYQSGHVGDVTYLHTSSNATYNMASNSSYVNSDDATTKKYAVMNLANWWQQNNKGAYASTIISDALSVGSYVLDGAGNESTVGQEIIGSMWKTSAINMFNIPLGFSSNGSNITYTYVVGGCADPVSQYTDRPWSPANRDTCGNALVKHYLDLSEWDTTYRYYVPYQGINAATLKSGSTPGICNSDVKVPEDIMSYGYLGVPGVYNSLEGNYKQMSQTLPRLLKSGSVSTSTPGYGTQIVTTTVPSDACYTTKTEKVGWYASKSNKIRKVKEANNNYRYFNQNWTVGESSAYYQQQNGVNKNYDYTDSVGLFNVVSSVDGGPYTGTTINVSNSGMVNFSLYSVPLVINNVKIKPLAANGVYENVVTPVAHYIEIMKKHGSGAGVWFEQTTHSYTGHGGYWGSDSGAGAKPLEVVSKWLPQGEKIINDILIHTPVSVEYCEVVSNDDCVDNSLPYNPDSNPYSPYSDVGHDQRVTNMGENVLTGYDGTTPIYQFKVDPDLLPDGNVDKDDYVVVDNKFYVFYSNFGNFYDNSYAPNNLTSLQMALGKSSTNDGAIVNGDGSISTTAGEGFSSYMDTSKWIASRWVTFGFPVEYTKSNGQKVVCPANTPINLNTMQSLGKGYRKIDTENTQVYQQGARNVYGDYYEFRVTTGVAEADDALVQFTSVGINDPAIVNAALTSYDANKFVVSTDKFVNSKRDTSFTAPHGAVKNDKIDIVGRIGNITLEDTDDYRFSSLFKTVKPGTWIIDGLVPGVNMADPFKTGSTRVTIFQDEANASNNYHGSLSYTDNGTGGKGDVYFELPLDATDNRVGNTSLNGTSLAHLINNVNGEELRLGYGVYMDIETVGNYYGVAATPTDEHPDGLSQGVYIIPRYYYVDIDTNQWKAVDIWYGDTGKEKLYYDFSYANKYNADVLRKTDKLSVEDIKNSSKLPYVTVKYNEERLLRNHRPATESIASLLKSKSNQRYLSVLDYNQVNIGTPSLYLLDHSVMNYIGSQYKNGSIHDAGNVLNFTEQQPISDAFSGTANGAFPMTQFHGTDLLSYYRQAQQWNFTLSLPSTAVPVPEGSITSITDGTSVMRKNRELTGGKDNGILVCLLEIVAKGDVWTLQFKNYSEAARMYNCYDISNNQLGLWVDNGDDTNTSVFVAIPNNLKDYIPAIVYDADASSYSDLGTYGSH